MAPDKMDIPAMFQKKSNLRGKINFVSFFSLALSLAIFFLVGSSVQADENWPHIVLSKDGTPISYETFGEGEPTLVFVHGWCCDARYWRFQVPYFAKKHRVIVMDLAGHGHSGMTRIKYTMASFGEDVQAVTEAVGSKQNILIGHSMAGSIIPEAAALMSDRVIGLIGVDTIDNIEYPVTEKELQEMIAPLEKSFIPGASAMVEKLIYPQTDPKLRQWITKDMSAAPPMVALSAMKEMVTQFITGEAAGIFENVHVSVVSVNGDLWTINYEANRRHMKSYDALVLEKADHFLMLDRPDEFNPLLEKAISMIKEKAKN